MSQLTVAISGDTMLARRVSVSKNERFLSLVNILRGCDAAFTHLETLIHDYDGPEVYPAAESGYTWMRSPHFAAEELKWMGFKIVSHASNHCMDYSYGGLYSTFEALDQVGIPHAGTGRNLGDARAPVYLETAGGRVALISMCPYVNGWARAGEARRDIKGRPGLNPLKVYYVADEDTMQMVKQLAIKMGWWVLKSGNELYFHPPGFHHSITKFVQGTEPGIQAAVETEDIEGNLRSIRDARRQSDVVLVHVHNHEWDPQKGLYAPPKFVKDFAKQCIDTGADVFIGEGSHTPLRGIEIYKNKPIFYDPGDLIQMNNTVTKLPHDFYVKMKPGIKGSIWEATVADALDARLALPSAINPPGGYHSSPVIGAIVGVCTLSDKGLIGLKLYPVNLVTQPRSQVGLPMLAEGAFAKKLIEHMKELSAEYGTEIEFKDGAGFVKISG